MSNQGRKRLRRNGKLSFSQVEKRIVLSANFVAGLEFGLHDPTVDEIQYSLPVQQQGGKQAHDSLQDAGLFTEALSPTRFTGTPASQLGNEGLFSSSDLYGSGQLTPHFPSTNITFESLDSFESLDQSFADDFIELPNLGPEDPFHASAELLFDFETLLPETVANARAVEALTVEIPFEQPIIEIRSLAAEPLTQLTTDAASESVVSSQSVFVNDTGLGRREAIFNQTFQSTSSTSSTSSASNASQDFSSVTRDNPVLGTTNGFDSINLDQPVQQEQVIVFNSNQSTRANVDPLPLEQSVTHAEAAEFVKSGSREASIAPNDHRFGGAHQATTISAPRANVDLLVSDHDGRASATESFFVSSGNPSDQESATSRALMTPRIRELGHQLLQDMHRDVEKREIKWQSEIEFSFFSVDQQAEAQSISRSIAQLQESSLKTIESVGLIANDGAFSLVQLGEKVNEATYRLASGSSVALGFPGPSSEVFIGLPIEPLGDFAEFDIFTSLTGNAGEDLTQETATLSLAGWAVVATSVAGSTSWILVRNSRLHRESSSRRQRDAREQPMFIACNQTVRATVQWAG